MTGGIQQNIAHSKEELKDFKEIQDQKDYRRLCVEKTMEENGYRLEDVDVFVGRGGGLLALVGGTYKVTELLAEHASRGMTASTRPSSHPRSASTSATNTTSLCLW
jgi:butyrate kinase